MLQIFDNVEIRTWSCRVRTVKATSEHKHSPKERFLSDATALSRALFWTKSPQDLALVHIILPKFETTSHKFAGKIDQNNFF